MARIYAALDIATSSSAYGEGFPNVLGEAMACGVPCVATDTGDTRLVIGETGIVVPPRDPAALASAWEQLIVLGRAGRRSLGMTARARIDGNYEIGSVVGGYEALYRDLVEGITFPQRMVRGPQQKMPSEGTREFTGFAAGSAFGATCPRGP